MDKLLRVGLLSAAPLQCPHVLARAFVSARHGLGISGGTRSACLAKALGVPLFRIQANQIEGQRHNQPTVPKIRRGNVRFMRGGQVRTDFRLDGTSRAGLALPHPGKLGTREETLSEVRLA
jgi:hypothetical protein